VPLVQAREENEQKEEKIKLDSFSTSTAEFYCQVPAVSHTELNDFRMLAVSASNGPRVGEDESQRQVVTGTFAI